MQPQQNGPRRNIRPKEAKVFTSEADGTSVPGGKHRRVVVVDDNPVALFAFERKLRSRGFEVTTISDPGAVASTAQQSHAQVIILDLNFFKSDFESGSTDWTGFTVMRWLKRFPEVANVPVIVVSGDEAAVSEKKALAEGAFAYFQKPVDSDKLVAAITAVLEKDADIGQKEPAADSAGQEPTCDI